MDKKTMLIQCVELAVRHGYDIAPLVGTSIRSLDWDYVAYFLADLREMEMEQNGVDEYHD